MSYKINFDEDRFFEIFGGDTPENRRWLRNQLKSSDETLYRRLIRIVTDSTAFDSYGNSRPFTDRITNAVSWLESLYQNTYNEAYARGQEDTRREVAEILRLL